MRIVTVVGARPQFIKAATIARRLRDSAYTGIEELIVHTGQHYDEKMSDQFFRDLEIPAPAVNLGVGSGAHGAQTGAIMGALERVLPDLRPDLMLVYGDTNSTLAAALVAAKAAVPLAHVEAGLRSFRPGMPEEVNRVVTDRLSTWLFCPTETAAMHLRGEGRSDGVHIVGDVMFDGYRFHATKPEVASAASRHGLDGKPFALVTMHRAENTDDPERLAFLLSALAQVAAEMPVLLPLHPRTQAAIVRTGLEPVGITIVEPLPYVDMIGLLGAAAVVATDSGGLQKEAFFSGTPCITLRDETEWVETVMTGWNCLMPKGGADTVAQAILRAAAAPPSLQPPLYGDGDAAGKILDILLAGR
jgi:UDP-GlcNAc3NAcA epimerase